MSGSEDSDARSYTYSEQVQSANVAANVIDVTTRHYARKLCHLNSLLSTLVLQPQRSAVHRPSYNYTHRLNKFDCNNFTSGWQM